MAIEDDTSTPRTFPELTRIPSSATAPPRIEYRTVGAAAPGTTAEFGDIYTTLSLQFPRTLIQGEWREDALPHSQLVLQSPVPEEAWEIITAAPFEIEVAISDGPTLEESYAVISEIGELIRASGNTAGSMGRYDVLSGVYSIDYFGEIELDPDELARITADAPVELWYHGPDSVGPETAN
jgi:hypothetical protein